MQKGRFYGYSIVLLLLALLSLTTIEWVNEALFGSQVFLPCVSDPRLVPPRQGVYRTTAHALCQASSRTNL